jgi:hypothetical protein
MVGTVEIPKRNKRRGESVFRTIARDVQFWIPVVVLIGGLVVLAWIQ